MAKEVYVNEMTWCGGGNVVFASVEWATLNSVFHQRELDEAICFKAEAELLSSVLTYLFSYIFVQ